MKMPGRSAKSNSGEIARSRLKLLLVSDQSGINPGIIGMIRDDLVRVLSRYAQIDAGAVELRLIRPEKDGKQALLITAAFPVRQITTVQSHLDSYMTRNEECS